MTLLIVGGGLIGTGIAWRAAQAGFKVVVIDKDCPQAASRVGAGLLICAGGRISHAHLKLRRASVGLYPEFVSELESESGLDCGYNPCGSLTLAYEPGATNALRGLSSCLGGLGVRVEVLTKEECLQREPALGDKVAGGFLTDDHQVDPVKLLAALKEGARLRGVEFLNAEVTEVAGSSVKCGSIVIEGDRVVVANGAWMSRLVPIDVFPVKGEVIEFANVPGLLNHNLILQKNSLYVANRGDGRLVVGATEEELGFDRSVSDGETLHQQVCALVPQLARHRPVAVRCGFRPRVDNGLPVIGEFEGKILAGAHYRNGILLTPITAQLVVEYLNSGSEPELMRPFCPTRLEKGVPRFRKDVD